MLLLVCIESDHLLLIRQSEGSRYKVETLRIKLLAKLHGTCEHIFVSQQLDIWVTITQLFFA